MGKMNLRKSAKGQDCTMEIVGVCNHDLETTVLCHVNYSGSGKMGGKEDDISAVYACSSCHDILDGRASPTMDFKHSHHWYVARALIRTHEIMFRLVK